MTSPSVCFSQVKAIALAVTDPERAGRFYGDTLSLAPVFEGGKQVGSRIGDAVLMFKTDWYGRPTDAPNPRITLETGDARGTEAALRAHGVVIPDPVERYDDYLVGSFLDSEGNKLWFCSAA